MKKFLTFILIITAVSLAACDNNSTSQNSETKTQSAQSTQTKTETKTPPPATAEIEAPESIAMLCADFSNGNSDLNIKKYELGYSSELTPEILLEGLSNLTGLDFIADITLTQMGILVDWKNESTLIANLDDREQKEDFHFFDAESMRWFMMDSLYRTLLENFDEEIFYSMNGEKELAFEELYPTKTFPINIPYMGSPFYFNHADGRGHIYNEDEASSYLMSMLEENGYDMNDTAIVVDESGGDAWFGDMAVWYFTQGMNTSSKFTAEKYFAVTYDWEIWAYDTANEEWTLWN